MNTVVYASTVEAREELLATRDKAQTLVAENVLTLDYLRDGSFKLFLAKIQNIAELPLKTLSQIHRILLNEGQVIVKFTEISKEDYEQFLKLLRAVGFKNNAPTQGATSNQVVFIKPEFQEAASLKRSVPAQQETVQPAQQPVNANVYGSYQHSPVVQVVPEEKKKPNAFVSAQQAASGVVDEDALLKDDVVAAKPVAVENCSTKPKACKNCNCGRKEKEATMTEEDLKKALERGDIKSSCGNCYLGDAFRCATCPYKGLPAFKLGDKVELDLGFSDNNLAQKQEGEIKVTGGKVKLDL